MITFIAGMFVGVVAGMAVTFWDMSHKESLRVIVAEEKVQRAFRECGKLAKKIHKQRVTIKALKANQIPKPKKQYHPQQTLSH